MFVTTRETVGFEGIVTSVNSSSFYVKKVDLDDTDYRMRFNRRSGISKGAIYYYEAFLSREIFDNMVKQIQKERELRADIAEYIEKLELEDLEEIKEIIKIKISPTGHPADTKSN